MQKVVVVGAGTMGNGIAHTFAQFGYPVLLIDANESALEKGLKTIQANFERQVQKQQVTEEQRDAALQRISTATSIDERAADADLVVEAASENFDIKSSIFRKLDEVCQPSCILASNTSSISITPYNTPTLHHSPSLNHSITLSSLTYFIIFAHRERQKKSCAGAER